MDVDWVKKIIEISLKPVCKFISWIDAKARSFFPPHPFKTLVIAHVNQTHSCWWHMGKMSDKDVMQVVADFLLTNVSKADIRLSGVLVNKKVKAKGMVLIQGGKYASANYIIPPGVTVEARCMTFIQPPVASIDEPYEDDIAIVDNFGNEHWFDKCHFDYT